MCCQHEPDQSEADADAGWMSTRAPQSQSQYMEFITL